MNTLLKNVKVIHPSSEYHKQNVDILIEGGIITKIGKNILSNQAEELSGKNLHCSIGLCDIGTHSGEPGFEQRETLDSLTKSALRGGYTALAIMPDTKPVNQNKAQLQFFINHPDNNRVRIYPIGALSKDLKGQDINEYFDMSDAGAAAFSDGLHSIQNSGLLSRALQYASTTGKSIIHHPDDHTLSSSGEMHEGETSTLLGMKGLPSLAEVHMVHRDILLMEYNDAGMMVHAISAAESVDMIKSAKKKGLKITSSVPYLNLIYNDETLMDFDQNLKVLPPLRSDKDRKALIKGIKDNTVDIIVSNHVPLDEEVKNLEFPYALPGATGLETCLVACLDGLKDILDIDIILEKMTINPRRLLNIEIPEIKVGNKADLCVFDLSDSWTYEKRDVQSKSYNNPFIGKPFSARVLRAIC